MNITTRAVKRLKRLGMRLVADDRLDVHLLRAGQGWLTSNLPLPKFSPPPAYDEKLIERRAHRTQRLGAKPIWEGYKGVSEYPRPTTGTRTSNEVRSNVRMGRFIAWLATQRRPHLVVEFGTAFGVSGMYWLSGLKELGFGHLLTFEPNKEWAQIAASNLNAISECYHLTTGTFEDNIERVLGRDQNVDITFIDAIHTSKFVLRQYEIVSRLTAPGGLVLLDDITFSDDMRHCWKSLAYGSDVVASASVGDRLGILELRS